MDKRKHVRSAIRAVEPPPPPKKKKHDRGSEGSNNMIMKGKLHSNIIISDVVGFFRRVR